MHQHLMGFFHFLIVCAVCVPIIVYICEKSFEMNTFLFILGVPEIVVIALVVLLLFGGKKIPELMRGLGKGVRSFKDGLNDNGDNNAQDSNNATKSDK